MTSLTKWALRAVCGLLALASQAKASQITTFDATGNFQYGGTLSGTVTIDTTTGTFTSWNLQAFGQTFSSQGPQANPSSGYTDFGLIPYLESAVPQSQSPGTFIYLSLFPPSNNLLKNYTGGQLLSQSNDTQSIHQSDETSYHNATFIPGNPSGHFLIGTNGNANLISGQLFVPVQPTTVNPGGGFTFTNVTSGSWFDPASAYGFDYKITTPGDLFTDIAGFPGGFGPVSVTANGQNLGTFSAGQTLTFAGSGVTEFTITGINPLVDPTNPNAFPLQLDFSQPNNDFTMDPIDNTQSTPEPATLTLLATGFLAFGGFHFVRRRRAPESSPVC